MHEAKPIVSCEKVFVAVSIASINKPTVCNTVIFNTAVFPHTALPRISIHVK